MRLLQSLRRDPWSCTRYLSPFGYRVGFVLSGLGVNLEGAGAYWRSPNSRGVPPHVASSVCLIVRQAEGAAGVSRRASCAGEVSLAGLEKWRTNLKSVDRENNDDSIRRRNSTGETAVKVYRRYALDCGLTFDEVKHWIRHACIALEIFNLEVADTLAWRYIDLFHEVSRQCKDETAGGCRGGACDPHNQVDSAQDAAVLLISERNFAKLYEAVMSDLQKLDKIKRQRQGEFRPRPWGRLYRSHQTFDEMYETVETLGQGQFGKVSRVRDRHTGFIRVCKTINKRKSSLPSAHLASEMEALRSLDHPNIVKLVEVFDDVDTIYLIEEFVDGVDMLQVLIDLGYTKEETSKGGAKTSKRMSGSCGCVGLSEEKARPLLFSVLAGLRHCHAKQVTHRDLKPANIMVSQETAADLVADRGEGLHGEVDVKATKRNARSVPTLKVIDFGLAEMFRVSRSSKIVAGTPLYMAPEVFSGRATSKCDIWSAGVFLYILLNLELPFDIDDVRNYRVPSLCFPEDSSLSEECRDLLQRMLVGDAEKRLTAYECLKHSWFSATIKRDNKFIDGMQMMTTVSRDKEFDSKSSGKLAAVVREHIQDKANSNKSVTTSDTKRNRDVLEAPLNAAAQDILLGGILSTEAARQETAASPRVGSEQAALQFLKYAKSIRLRRLILNLIASHMTVSDLPAASEITEVFGALDTDHDGELDIDELTIGLRKLGVAPDMIPKVISALDQGGGGRISFTEFVVPFIAAGSAEFERFAMSAFVRLLDQGGRDPSHNEAVKISELQKVLFSKLDLYQFNKQRVETRRKTADGGGGEADIDGANGHSSSGSQLDKSEYSFLEEETRTLIADLLDENQNGEISFDEFLNFLTEDTRGSALLGTETIDG